MLIPGLPTWGVLQTFAESRQVAPGAFDCCMNYWPVSRLELASLPVSTVNIWVATDVSAGACMKG